MVVQFDLGNWSHILVEILSALFCVVVLLSERLPQLSSRRIECHRGLFENIPMV